MVLPNAQNWIWERWLVGSYTPILERPISRLKSQHITWMYQWRTLAIALRSELYILYLNTIPNDNNKNNLLKGSHYHLRYKLKYTACLTIHHILVIGWVNIHQMILHYSLSIFAYMIDPKSSTESHVKTCYSVPFKVSCERKRAEEAKKNLQPYDTKET